MRSNRQQGFSLVEITVVLAIVSVMMIVVYTMIEQTMRATMFNESHNDLAALSQKGVNALQTELLQTKMAFQEDALGASYRAALQLPSAHPVWSDSLLPMFQASTTIAPDTSTRFTGNSLLLVRQLEPLSILYDDDNNASTPEVEFLADRYRFEYIFLKRDSRSFARSGMSLDLMIATSPEYADYFQLNALGAQTGRVVTRIVAAGLQQEWDPGRAINNAFYTLADATDGTFGAPLNRPSIPIVRTKSILPGLSGGHISGKMGYSVAFVPDPPAQPFPIRMPIAVYAQPLAGRPGFPAGFEVKIAGPAGNRQVMTRLLLMSQYGVTSYESQQGFVTTAARF